MRRSRCVFRPATKRVERFNGYGHRHRGSTTLFSRANKITIVVTLVLGAGAVLGIVAAERRALRERPGLTAEATHQAESAKDSEEIYNKPSVTADRRIAPGGKTVRRRAIQSAASPVTLHNVTLAGFETLRTGMSLADVERVLRASGTELSRSEIGDITTVMYTWQGEGILGANMNAMFQNNRLISKAQFGLR